MNAREIAALVPMARLLDVLGFEVNERTGRSRCLLHDGANATAFSWREDGRWHCFACGAGGDRIALVRGVRKCSFPDAARFLAKIAGVEYVVPRPSRLKIGAAQEKRERVTAAAWRVRDEVVRLRSYYRDGLHRAERLWQRLGAELFRSQGEAEREAVWECMARLAPICTFFLAGFDSLNRADTATLTRFALYPAERRALILGVENVPA